MLFIQFHKYDDFSDEETQRIVAIGMGMTDYEWTHSSSGWVLKGGYRSLEQAIGYLNREGFQGWTPILEDYI
jgi:hypothetical protein